MAKKLFFIFIFLLIILTGTSGYMIIEGWNFIDSLYMTVITVTTIGFTEVRPLSVYGRVFTILFALIGIGVITTFISIISSIITQTKIIENYRRKKMEKSISRLKNHVIVCGAGNIGRYVIKELVRENKRPVVVIDNDPNFINLAQKDLKDIDYNEKSLFFVEGDPSKEDILLNHANINNAYGLVTCLPNDSSNLLISLTVKNLNPRVKVSAFVIEEENIPKFYLLGVDDVISGNFIIGKRLATSMVNENILSFIEQISFIRDRSYYIADIVISSDSKVIGKTLRELNLPNNFDLLVVAVKSQDFSEYIFNPKADYTINKNDVLIVMGKKKISRKLVIMSKISFL
ncbi:MAG TPA: potassium channel protein [Spirochaetota bacterium]|nr:potassium channel protein [Spirochaetota bacterium]HOM37597.1 potassium channel protein [Spirochaetota bacterium]HPQ49432.1 potassium channel protein [Spirochaetota bacterium]